MNLCLFLCKLLELCKVKSKTQTRSAKEHKSRDVRSVLPNCPLKFGPISISSKNEWCSYIPRFSPNAVKYVFGFRNLRGEQWHLVLL